MAGAPSLIGPLRFNTEAVDFVVKGALPGVFALGALRWGGKFEPAFVGRADDDLRAELLTHAAEGRYQAFAFHYDAFAQRAFEHQCQAYHKFRAARRLDNKGHPEPAPGETWICAICEARKGRGLLAWFRRTFAKRPIAA